MQVLAIVGMTGSGKSELAAYLHSLKHPVVRFGQITIDEIVRRGLEISPENERTVREELRAQHGTAVYAEQSLPHITKHLDTHPLVVIDGLYSMSEFKLIRAAFGAALFVVAVFTPRQVRYSRLTTRAERPLTLEQAEQRDFSEIDKLEKGGPIALADVTLINSGTVAELCSMADSLLSSLHA